MYLQQTTKRGYRTNWWQTFLDQHLQDDSSGEVQFNPEIRKAYEGAADETVPLTSLDSPASEWTSTPVRKSVVPRTQINRFLHTLIWKTNGSSTGNRNCISFHELSAAERVERHTQFLSRVDEPSMFHIST